MLNILLGILLWQLVTTIVLVIADKYHKGDECVILTGCGVWYWVVSAIDWVYRQLFK